MTARRPKPSDLPGWPRGLSAELAAAYVGVSVNTFLDQVEKGVWPKPKRIKGGLAANDDGKTRGGRLIWDRAEIDARFDDLSGFAQRRRTKGMIERAKQWADS
ncbi:MAG TPA: hypothetical protein VF188_16245 [Longimicrobiales bacterium]